MIRKILLSWLIFLLACTSISAQQNLQLYDLSCETFQNPVGIDAKQPRFAWKMKSDEQNQEQTAYQILIATSENSLTEQNADVWNSGKIKTEQSQYVSYQGKPLQSNQKYFWKVKVWDKQNRPSAWSETNYFVTGILNPDDWKAQWIGAWFPDEYAPEWQYGQWIGTGKENMGEAFYRKSFQLDNAENISKAQLRLSSPNKTDVYVNDRLVKKCQHWPGMHEIDLDFFLRRGKNTIAIHATDKPANNPVISGSIYIEYQDGTHRFIATDNSWKSAPIQAPAEWYNRFFYDENWQQAVTVQPQNPGKEPAKGPRSIMLRKEFELNNSTRSAIVNISGLGSYQLFVNGQKVDDQLLTPGWTEFDQRVEYQTYDVSDYLSAGKNAVGILLGNSWWEFHLRNFKEEGIDSLLKANLQMTIQDTDGETRYFITDETWKSHPSPVLMNHIYHGEVYDFNRQRDGWTKPGFDDENWSSVKTIEYDVPLVAQQAEPIRVTEERSPHKITKTQYGSYIVDFGQNMAGWVKIKAPKTPSDKIFIQYAELQNPDGSLFLGNLRTAKSINKYLLAGDETGWLEPHFTYHGFRWVEIYGYPDGLSENDILARVIHTDIPVSGHFECSDTLINQIYQNELWTFRSNFYAVPTDCPQRDERLGWMADAGNIPQVASYFMKVDKYFDKWVYDMEDSQQKTGHMPDYSPTRGAFEYGSNLGAPGWADACIKVPYTLYKFYGDTSILINHYDAMKQHVEDMRARSENNLYKKEGWGDWLAVEPSPSEPFGTAYYFYSTQKLAEIAAIIDKSADAEMYNTLAQEIANAYQNEYFNDSTHAYIANTQTMNVLPVNMGITPKEKQKAVIQNIIKDIEAHENHFTTGFLGTTFLFPELAKHGHNALIYDMVTHRDYPSWGRIIDNGATTMTEAWNAYMGEDFASHNHFNLGSVNEWFFAYLAGIQPDINHPGFKHFYIKPVIVDSLSFVESSYETGYGTIRSEWRKESGKLKFKIEIPVNTTATVYVPEAANATKQKPVRKKDGYNVFELGSGSYTF